MMKPNSEDGKRLFDYIEQRFNQLETLIKESQQPKEEPKRRAKKEGE